MQNGHGITGRSDTEEGLIVLRISSRQALQGKEMLHADITEEEMAHQTQVSALSQLHL